MKKVDVDSGAGFCFGVEEVIKTAESHLKEGKPLYGLGEMVHNPQEVKRLEELGLITIDHRELGDLKPDRVLLRAHGEPPSTYRLAREHGIEIIDGTCPIVLRLQKKIGEVYSSMDRNTQQLVIFGKPDHPETIGLLGQVGGDAAVISSVEDLPAIDPEKRILLFSQTTMDPDLYREVEAGLRERMIHHVNLQQGELLESNCTVCGQMKRRKPGLSEFARSYDLVLFVSGKHSANGKMLFEFCKSVNPLTHWISAADEIDPDWFKTVESIGISGATSTSMNQLQEIKEEVKKLIFS